MITTLIICIPITALVVGFCLGAKITMSVTPNVIRTLEKEGYLKINKTGETK